MKIVIELPDNWLDTDLTGNLDWIARTVREEVKSSLVKAISEQVEVPKVEFTAEELKPLILDKIASERARDDRPY